MTTANRSTRRRALRPAVAALEDRALLNAALPHVSHPKDTPAHVAIEHHQTKSQGPTITPINVVTADGYRFVNFDGPNAGTAAGDGTNMNGISNSGTSVGFTIENNGDLENFTVNPLRSRNATVLNINGSTQAMAFGTNAHGTVVGTDGNNNAFALTGRKLMTFIPNGGTSAIAFGINDKGVIVGQYTTSAGTTPGFIRVNAKSTITINAPSGPNLVNAQSINNEGLVVGFYQGTDGNVHGFIANEKSGAHSGKITGTPVADPVIPTVAGEPGATFVFSQILGVNDHGIAVGYYGDSTLSQHGFLYNTHTGQYMFLDDPSEAFDNGVEVTQITGINNAGEITGFYTDANGVAHGFVATPPRGW